MAENRAQRRGRGHGVPVEKAKDFKGSVSKLMQYMRPYRISIFIVFLFAVGSTVFNIIGPKVLGKATDILAEGMEAKFGGTGAIEFDRIGRVILICLALYVVSAFFGWIQGYIMAGIAQKTCYRLRKDLSEKMSRLPMNYYDTKTHGEILSRVTNDIDMLGQSFNQSVTQLITSVISVIGIFIMMLTLSPLLTLVSVLIVPLSGVLVAFTVKKSQKYFMAQQEYLGHINGQVEEVYGGQNVVRVFNHEDQVIKEFNETNEVLFESAWKSQFFSGMMMPITNFIGNIGYVAVAIIGGILTVRGKMSIGGIQSFIQYVRSFTQPIGQLAQVSNMLQSTAAAAERVFEFLGETEEDQTAENPADVSKAEGNVTFENVSFGYKPDHAIINNFNADIKEGQKIAIVGPTGAGKTTMVKLLMRFYDVNSGSIKIDGHDIRNFNRSELRELFGMVLQDTWLFKGSIMENIRYGKLDATDEEVIAAAKAAHADYFIQALPGGYQMELNEETSNVSQGQKQLLTIARAILANNKILILDEATSSVDTRTEILIQKAMDNLMKGRTSFVIAHRLSTIRDADLILVMKDGDVIEQGNHDELMMQDGFYAQLYNSQFDQTA
ncbi:ABC transporter ATP-binding protein [[Clostridium] polysaccharolyticum]|uniref:ATP-binding cassette, subfamily B n=1 Tax=[Clostridium] polysaccharolyticum TaxID=29364 RepID=A0A1H9YAB0_9FIRM|nr:ABC transporter ATP-binding protein [[Clostridium] polysaccharolyticum]SES65799.1 ATP-binding cassette, subfamily B [[Clostridium] polysaccharolyticum]